MSTATDYYLPFYDDAHDFPANKEMMLEEFMTICEKRLAFLKELDVAYIF
jgi:hypothetical protein